MECLGSAWAGQGVRLGLRYSEAAAAAAWGWFAGTGRLVERGGQSGKPHPGVLVSSALLGLGSGAAYASAMMQGEAGGSGQRALSLSPGPLLGAPASSLWPDSCGAQGGAAAT